MKKVLDPDELGRDSQYKLSLQDIMSALKSKNFAEIIQWSGEVCTISSITTFKHTVLPKFDGVDSLSGFLRTLKKFNVKSRKIKEKLTIDFAVTGNKKVYNNKIIKYLDKIDNKNEKICEKFKNIREKLHSVITTNEQIKKILNNKANDSIGIEIFDYYKELIPLKIQKKLQKNIIF